ncbi:MAG: aspartate aminotransferase family protein [Mycobacterium sp.]|nr:aspartate aminotransferase family protein [Mycobacterium sp.]
MPTTSELAARHLWMHFTKLGAYAAHEVPVITRGEGCYVEDAHGKRYLDGLSGLFTVQVGHGRAELAEAARAQAETLAYFPVWSFAHEPAATLAHRLAEYAPGDLNRVFFTPSGGDAVESAIKFARQYWKLRGQPMKHKVMSRYLAYHGTSMGALSLTGVPSIKAPFEPLVPGAVKVQTPYRYRCNDCMNLGACTLRCADDLALRIEMEGPDTVAAVFMEPVQNTGGAFTPPDGYWQRVREICDEYDVLLVSDETICAFGRIGSMFACNDFNYVPDIITCAKGLTSGYAPLGAMIASDRLFEPFNNTDHIFAHGYTWGGHPVSAAAALANLDVFEREKLNDHVKTTAPAFRATLEKLLDLPIVGDVRGEGFFYGIELVKDKATKEILDDELSEWLLRSFLSTELFEAGLYCRADDRGDSVVQLAPPLISDQALFDEIEQILRGIFTQAWDHLQTRGNAWK